MRSNLKVNIKQHLPPILFSQCDIFCRAKQEKKNDLNLFDSKCKFGGMPTHPITGTYNILKQSINNDVVLVNIIFSAGVTW